MTQEHSPSPAPPPTEEEAAKGTAPVKDAAPPPADGAPKPETSGGSPPPDPPEGKQKGELKVKLFARTDVGQVREHNEDNFLVADLTRKSRGLMESNRSAAVGPHGAIFAVCDGMGGAAAGEIASQLAVDIIYERMIEGLDASKASDRDEIARRLVHAVEAAGLRIFQEAKLDRTRRGMGTTVTASALVDDHIFFAQVGDSRGYILRGGVLTQVTRDQSLVNQLIEAGQLTEEEAETFEHNNIILQALGTSDTVQVDLTFAELHRGDMLLLCSDGLSGMVRFEEIREIMRSSQEPIEICKALTERANQAGGHDNITVIIVVFDGEGLAPLTSETEALKYQKYILPEEPADDTDAFRRTAALGGSPDSDPSAGAGGEAAPDAEGQAAGKPDPARSGSTSVRPRDSGSGAGQMWHEEGPHAEADDRIEIPGTHVPTWVVVAIVVGVVALLTATAFFLLR